MYANEQLERFHLDTDDTGNGRHHCLAQRKAQDCESLPTMPNFRYEA